MNIEYTASRQHIYGLEFVRSEMELKVTEAKRRNKDFDSSDAEKKIKAISDSQNFLHVMYEEIERIKKINFELNFTKDKLIAENLILKNNK